MRFCSATLGCKVNQYDTQAIESILTSRGHVQVAPGEGSDVCIINTCAVTAESVRKSRQTIRRMKKLEPGALIAVCGCFSQLDPSTPALLGADLVGGSGDRHEFALKIESASGRFSSADNLGQESAPAEFSSVSAEQGSSTIVSPMAIMHDNHPPVSSSRTRALMKIQDGCDNYCAYCIIPYARGRARSLSLDSAADYARQLGEQGFREIVVTGIEISSYGKDLEGNIALIDVVRKISGASPNVRLRLGSLDPCVVTDEFCAEMGGISSLCDHFHLSLQSGCDETLRRMGRKYNTDVVLEAVSSLRSRFPDGGITADLIVGFPGETDEEFKQTLEFIKTAAFSNMHIFPFSIREGTRAADMPNQITRDIKRGRAKIAARLAEEMASEFRLSQIGNNVEVLFERKRGGFWTGHSGNYIEVAVKAGGSKNSVQAVRITGVDNGFVWGEITGS